MSEDMFDKAQLAPWRTLGDAIGDMDDPGEVGLDFSPRKKHFLAQVPQGSNWRSLPQEAQKQSMGKEWDEQVGRSGWWCRLNFYLHSPTLCTRPNTARPALSHPTETLPHHDKP